MAAKEIAERVDGVARVVMALIADLERRELVDGARFCAGLREMAEGRRTVAGLATAARVIEQIAAELDEAREVRRSRERSH